MNSRLAYATCDFQASLSYLGDVSTRTKIWHKEKEEVKMGEGRREEGRRQKEKAE